MDSPCGKECKPLAIIEKRLMEGDKTFQDMAEFMIRFNNFMDEWPKVKRQVEETADIVNAWNNAKGAVETIKGISTTVKVLAPIGLLLAGMAYVIRRMGL